MFVRKLTFRLALFFVIAAVSVVSSAGSALAKCVIVTVPLTPVYNHEGGAKCSFWPPSCGVDHLAFQGTGYGVWTETPLFYLGTNTLLQTGWIARSDVRVVPCTRQLRRLDRKRALTQPRQSK